MWRLIENDGAVNCQTCIGKSRAAYKKKFLSYHQTDGLSRFKQEANSDLVNRMCFYSMWLDWVHLSLVFRAKDDDIIFLKKERSTIILDFLRYCK